MKKNFKLWHLIGISISLILLFLLYYKYVSFTYDHLIYGLDYAKEDVLANYVIVIIGGIILLVLQIVFGSYLMLFSMLGIMISMINPIYGVIVFMVSSLIGSSIIYLINKKKKYETLYLPASVTIKELKKYSRMKNDFWYTLTLSLNPRVSYQSLASYASCNLSYFKYMLCMMLCIIPNSIYVIGIYYLLFDIYFVYNNLLLLFVILIPIVTLIIFGLVALLLNRIYIPKEDRKNVQGFWYYPFYLIIHLLGCFKRKVEYNYEHVDEINGPAVIMANHGSGLDFALVMKLLKGYKLTLVANSYYFRTRFFKFGLSKNNAVSKKMFYTDMDSVKGMIEALRSDRYLMLFPDAKLSVDGSSYPIAPGTSKLFKKFNPQLVFIKIEGNFFVKPKWAKDLRKGKVRVGISKIINPSEYSDLSVEELDKLINDNFYVNNYDYLKENNNTYKSKDISLGVDGILFHCPKCDKEFEINAKDNHIKCSCGYDLEMNNRYELIGDENIKTLYDWNKYQIQKVEEELKDIDSYKLSMNVRCVVLDPFDSKKDKTSNGVFSIGDGKYSYRSEDGEIDFAIEYKKISSIPYGANREFEFYYNGLLHYFYPENPKICSKISIISDILYNKSK